MPEVEFWLVGPEEFPGEYAKIEAKQRELRVESHSKLVKGLPQAEMLRLYPTMDALVLPSYREGLPAVLLEAMACGLSVVATRVGAIPEVVVDGVSGLLIDPGNLPDLEDSLVKVCADPDLRLRLGREAYKRVLERYSQDTAGRAFNELYERLAS